MNQSRRFSLEDCNPMSWNEFDTLVKKMLHEITLYCSDHGIDLDATAPILRNGGIPATMIANALQIIPMIPIQIKCDYLQGTSIQLSPVGKPLIADFRSNPTILVVECNTFSGASARLAASCMKTVYPDATLLYATVTQVFRKEPVDLSMYGHVFTGVLTNENFEATTKEEGAMQLRPRVVIYPWETAANEIADINATLEK